MRRRERLGPFESNNLPFQNVKISGLMAKIKPNGKARVIISITGQEAWASDPQAVGEEAHRLELFLIDEEYLL